MNKQLGPSSGSGHYTGEGLIQDDDNFFGGGQSIPVIIRFKNLNAYPRRQRQAYVQGLDSNAFSGKFVSRTCLSDFS